MQTVAGSNAAATKQTLSFCEEWHNMVRDHVDAGSVYTMLAALESTVKASSIDLGLE